MPMGPFILLAAGAAQLALPAPDQLAEQVRAADQQLFALFFGVKCEPEKLRALIADDFEMYHDKGGVIATDADQFMAQYAEACAARAKPDAWFSRRAIVPSSLRIDPVPGFGAIEDGDHDFYERNGADGPEKLAGHAHFTQLWQFTAGGWKLKRVFSYSHRAATETVPQSR